MNVDMACKCTPQACYVHDRTHFMATASTASARKIKKCGKIQTLTDVASSLFVLLPDLQVDLWPASKTLHDNPHSSLHGGHALDCTAGNESLDHLAQEMCINWMRPDRAVALCRLICLCLATFLPFKQFPGLPSNKIPLHASKVYGY